MMTETKSSEDTKSSCVSALISCFNLGSKKKSSASPGPTPKPAVPCEPKPQSPTKSTGDSVLNGKAESVSSKYAGTGNADANSKHSRESAEAHVEAPSSDVQLVKCQSIIVTENAPIDLWHEALNKTHQDTKSWMGKFGVDRSSTIQVQELTTLVRQSEETYQDASSGLKIGERNILWRDYANRVVAWVTMIGDISVPFAPAPVSPVWSALRVLLQAETSRVEQITAAFGAADRILSIIRRGQIYESVYGLSSANLTEPSRVLLRDSIIKLYRSSLDLLASTSTQLNGQESWATQFLTALTDPDRTESLLSDLTAAENDVSKNAEACVCESTERNLELLQSLHSPLRRIDDRVVQLLDCFKDMESRDREHAMDYISDVKVDEIHVAKKELRTEGTCEWLIQHPSFLAWEEPSSSSILWLNGQVGAGKSFLTSKVIDRYRSRPGDTLRSSENDEGFAHFYCDRSLVGRKDIKSILSSYIVQLLAVSRHRDRWHKQLLTFCKDAAASRRSLEISECERFVRELVNTYPRSILVLDALDECDQRSRAQIVTFFQKLVEDSDRPVKVFISSRPETDLIELMETSSYIQISTSDNHKDIQKYIDLKLSQVGLSPVWKRQSVRSLVRETLLEKHGGMFKWVQLQWDQLEPLSTEIDVKQRLMKLPEGLVASYEEICSRQNGHALAVLMRAAMWVKWAKIPLPTKVLLQVVKLPFCKTHEEFEAALNQESITETELGNICRHLITFQEIFSERRATDAKHWNWRFPHASVAEFFDNKLDHWKETENSELYIATSLLLQASLPREHRVGEMGSYTDIGATELRSSYGHLRIHPLLMDTDGLASPAAAIVNFTFSAYAHTSWLDFVRRIFERRSGTEEILGVLGYCLGLGATADTSSFRYQTDLNGKMALRRNWLLENYEEMQPWCNPVFAACGLGSLDLLEHLRRIGYVFDEATPGQTDSFLSIAARHGYDEICSFLIDNGAKINVKDVNRIDRYQKYPLHHACGTLSTVKLLLSRGADPNLHYEHTPLCEVIQDNMDSTDILSALLDWKADPADPNLPCKSNVLCCLTSAFRIDNAEGLELLLDHKLDLTLWRNTDQTVLESAAYYGAAQCIRVLLDRKLGYNVDSSIGEVHDSMLRAAVCSGNRKSLQYLIEGLKVDPKTLISNPLEPTKLRNHFSVAYYFLREQHWTQEEALKIGIKHEDVAFWVRDLEDSEEDL
ncbi:hypothetical protein HER10_EVM0005702 [Colletotrichum scovillei]|uniref:Ankyrin protein n=1 Tax=Colletotrichum scovillei TaxID=1209932 RepID=A0A9P7RIK9_9PEZI|nr:uncharacterized protein HER10_EVM0005702 [Colletotrichum scovillei]KAF4779663.1 hypothetical protein HER10_EVM0005702 [Colletotrichum scovillei]KAG7058214.1 ankyrin protein [Colletotrichum scovillei]KAG7076891.1 ankyrin protein [Colletotrichum scovillei]KAG7083926.1 ankyrin protein [Colletotrichum scovillei]